MYTKWTASDLTLIRSDTGDGGWSLHTPLAIAEADAHGDGAEAILSGPAEWDQRAGKWDRPNAEDYRNALALANRPA